MKAECSLEKLKTIVPVVEKITGKNLVLNILSSVLVIASGKTIKFRATNLDVGVEFEFPAKIEKEGVVAVKGDTLNDLIFNIQNEKSVIFESSNDNILVITPNNKAVIKCYPYTDFPTIPLITGDVCFITNPQKILAGVKSVYYSSSISNIKPEISSIYIYPNGDDLVFVATDSFRLAEKKIKVKNLPDFSGVIIPHKNINEIIKVLDLADSDIKVCFNKNQIAFSYDGVYVTSRLIDGNFPDYKQIIPKEIKTNVIVLKQDLLNAMKINSIFMDKFNQINIDIKPKSKKVSVSSQNSDVGETKTEITATTKGDDIVVHLNYKYLFDVFQSINTDSASIDLSGSNKPIIISGVSDQTFTYLIMPLNR